MEDIEVIKDILRMLLQHEYGRGLSRTNEGRFVHKTGMSFPEWIGRAYGQYAKRLLLNSTCRICRTLGCTKCSNCEHH